MVEVKLGELGRGELDDALAGRERDALAHGDLFDGGDKVLFQAVLTPPQDFQIVFPAELNPTVWASPFDVTQNSFQAVDQGPLESTNRLPVSDGNDPAGTQFQFVAALADGTAQSDPFTLELA